MNEDEFNKKLKGTKWFWTLVSCVFSFVLIIFIIQQKLLLAMLCLAFIICFILFYSFTKRKIIAGPIIGIALGCLYLISFMWTRSILSIALGIVVVLDSVSMFKFLKNS